MYFHSISVLSQEIVEGRNPDKLKVRYNNTQHTTSQLVGIVFTFILFSGVTIHGGPSPERGAGEHVWELHHPKGPVISVSGVTGRDPGSGCQPGVEERERRQRRERLAAAAGVRLQLRPVVQDGQISTEVNNFSHLCTEIMLMKILTLTRKGGVR